MLVGTSRLIPVSGALRYFAPTGWYMSSTLADGSVPFTACTLKKMRINITSNVLIARNMYVTLQKNGVDTALTITVVPTETGLKTVSADVTVSEDDLLSVEVDLTELGSGYCVFSFSLDFL